MWLLKKAAFATTGFVTTVALLMAAPPSHADAPEKVTYEQGGVIWLYDLCDVAVLLEYHQKITRITFVDATGQRVRRVYHVVERDTFSANGVTLVATPYRFTTHVSYDPFGNVVNNVATGVLIKVPLSPGVTFMSVGRFDFLRSGGVSTVVPTNGTSRHQRTFCSALSG